MNIHQENSNYEPLWKAFSHDFALSQNQREMFQKYAFLLIEWNKKFNLTAIIDQSKIITGHFYDSMNISHAIDFLTVASIADVGTGAGFPAVPLKILYPHLTVTLIEVNSKKRAFLEYLIAEFDLKNVTVIKNDWRTFLRSSLYTIDYFFARASLQPEELVRLFKPSCFYHTATLVYWASDQWQAPAALQKLIQKEHEYTIGNAKRRYIFLKP